MGFWKPVKAWVGWSTQGKYSGKCWNSAALLKHTHTPISLSFSIKITHSPYLYETHTRSLLHTRCMEPGGAVSARSRSLLSWVQLVTWAASLNNSVIPKSFLAAEMLRGTGPPKHTFYNIHWLRDWILKFSSQSHFCCLEVAYHKRRARIKSCLCSLMGTVCIQKPVISVTQWKSRVMNVSADGMRQAGPRPPRFN